MKILRPSTKVLCPPTNEILATGLLVRILLEGVGLFLCSDARGRKIEIARPGLGVLWRDVVPSC